VRVACGGLEGCAGSGKTRRKLIGDRVDPPKPLTPLQLEPDLQRAYFARAISQALSGFQPPCFPLGPWGPGA